MSSLSSCSQLPSSDLSSFIVNNEKDKYGDKQTDYIARANATISHAVKSFQEAATAGKDLIKLFHETLAFFGEERHHIARDHKTEKAEYFGIRRDKEEFKGPCGMTPLCGCYREYDDRILPTIQANLKQMEHTFQEFQQTELKIQSDRYLNRGFSKEVSILTYDMMKNWSTSEREEYERICKLCNVSPKTKDEHLGTLSHNKEAMQTLKTKYPDDYKRLKLSIAILELRKQFPEERKSDWVFVTLRLEVNEKMYALSQYLTWAYRDFKTDPIERMTMHSLVTIIHQDPFLIDIMLDDIAKVFKRALEWDKKNLKDLMTTVALFEYEFAHSMPHLRGSGAIAEWFEVALFRYHGYNLRYNQKKMVTFEAYSSSLKEFVESYGSMVYLDNIDAKKEPMKDDIKQDG